MLWPKGRATAKLSYHDPLVKTWDIDGVSVPCVEDHLAAAETADLTVLLQNHTSYDLEALAMRAHRVFDTRGSMVGPAVERM